VTPLASASTHAGNPVAFFVYEIVTYLERGWWIIDATDVGARDRAATLANVGPTARTLVARSVGVPEASFDIDLHVIRNHDGGIARARWRSRLRETPGALGAVAVRLR
jgi:hypothetical protein